MIAGCRRALSTQRWSTTGSGSTEGGGGDGRAAQVALAGRDLIEHLNVSQLFGEAHAISTMAALGDNAE